MNKDSDNNSNKDAWLCDSDPQSYCLTSNLYFNQLDRSGMALKPSPSSLFVSSSQLLVDTMNTSTVRGSRSGSAGSSHSSSATLMEEGDSLLNHSSHSSSNHSLQQERNNLFAYYHFQKVRAGSVGSYGSLSNYKLNKFNLAISSNDSKHHLSPLLSRNKPGPLPSIMDHTTTSDTDTNNADEKKGIIAVSNSRQLSSNKLEKEYELQVEPRSSSTINADRVLSINKTRPQSIQISVIPNPNSGISNNNSNRLGTEAQHVPSPIAHAAISVINTTPTVNPRPTRPTPFLPFSSSAYAAVESPTSSPTSATARHHNRNNNDDSKNSNSNNTTSNTKNQHLLNRSKTPGLSPKPHPLGNTSPSVNNSNIRTTSTTVHQHQRERKNLIRRDSEAII